MPASIVDINLDAQTGAIPQQTYSDALILGRASDMDGAPVPGYNRVERYSSATEVEEDYGEDSSVYTASQEVAGRGAEHWHVLVFDEESHTEIIGDSDTESTNEGFVEDIPITGGVDEVTVTVDGTEMTVVPSTETPPEVPDDANTAHVNFDTGEVVVGTESSGTETGIEVDYSSLTWDAALPEIEASPADLMAFADLRADRSYIGDVDEAVTFAGANRMVVIAALENGSRLDDDRDGVTLANDFGSYIPAAELMTLSHKTDDDLASEVLGQLAVNEPWFDPMMDGDGYGVSADYYRRSLIGSPSDPNTFEGGDTNGEGPSNVLFIPSVNNQAVGTQVLSNSLTTAGAGSNYRYLDVKRTENMVAVEVIRGLTNLKLRQDQIPFDPEGQILIYDALKSALQEYVGGDGPLRTPTDEDGEEIDMVHVPEWDELTQDDRANRHWSGIRVRYRLAGNAHTFSVVINATV